MSVPYPVHGTGELERQAGLEEAAHWVSVFMGANAVLAVILLALVLWLVFGRGPTAGD